MKLLFVYCASSGLLFFKVSLLSVKSSPYLENAQHIRENNLKENTLLSKVCILIVLIKTYPKESPPELPLYFWVFYSPQKSSSKILFVHVYGDGGVPRSKYPYHTAVISL